MVMVRPSSRHATVVYFGNESVCRNWSITNKLLGHVSDKSSEFMASHE